MHSVQRLFSLVYQELFGEKYDRNNFNHRRLMQSVVWLMEKKRIILGDYRFRFISENSSTNLRPYSEGLDLDLTEDSDDWMGPYYLSKNMQKAVQTIKSLVIAGGNRDKVEWIEAIVCCINNAKNKFDIDPQVIMVFLEDKVK